MKIRQNIRLKTVLFISFGFMFYCILRSFGYFQTFFGPLIFYLFDPLESVYGTGWKSNLYVAFGCCGNGTQKFRN